MRVDRLRHQFVDFVPDLLDEGVLYVCLQYATVVHRCCCGCGREVVTPLSPTDWRLTFNGEAIWLAPSIGNWNYPCRSHYWIQGSQVQWSDSMSDKEIREGRQADQRAKRRHYAPAAVTKPSSASTPADTSGGVSAKSLKARRPRRRKRS